jgi:hypothetical protein
VVVRDAHLAGGTADGLFDKAMRKQHLKVRKRTLNIQSEKAPNTEILMRDRPDLGGYGTTV